MFVRFVLPVAAVTLSLGMAGESYAQSCRLPRYAPRRCRRRGH